MFSNERVLHYRHITTYFSSSSSMSSSWRPTQALTTNWQVLLLPTHSKVKPYLKTYLTSNRLPGTLNGVSGLLCLTDIQFDSEIELRKKKIIFPWRQLSPDRDFWHGLFHTWLFDQNFGNSYMHHKTQSVLFTRCKPYKPILRPNDIYRFSSYLKENTKPTLLPPGVCCLGKLLFKSES
jgi:hypothetical protein